MYESLTNWTFVTGPTAEKKGLKSSSVASYLMFAKKTLLGTSDSSFRRAFSPTVPPVFLKVTRLVFLRLTRISTVVVVARRSVAGKWVRRAAKGRVLVAVKRRRRSVRIVMYGCGDGVIVAAMAFAVAVQCGSVQRRQQRGRPVVRMQRCCASKDGSRDIFPQSSVP